MSVLRKYMIDSYLKKVNEVVLRYCVRVFQSKQDTHLD